MTFHYLTKSYRVVAIDLGDLPDSLLPAALWIRRGGDSGDGSDSKVVEPAWLITPQLIATLAWRYDTAQHAAQSNKTAAPGSSEASERARRWFALIDALGAIFDEMEAECCDLYDRYKLTGGPPPLPAPPSLGIGRPGETLLDLTPPIAWDSEVPDCDATRNKPLRVTIGGFAMPAESEVNE